MRKFRNEGTSREWERAIKQIPHVDKLSVSLRLGGSRNAAVVPNFLISVSLCTHYSLLTYVSKSVSEMPFFSKGWYEKSWVNLKKNVCAEG